MIVTNVDFSFIASTPTKDDPLGQRAYFTWKASIGPSSGPLQSYGLAHELPGAEYREWTAEQRATWVSRGMTELEQVLRDLSAKEQVVA